MPVKYDTITRVHILDAWVAYYRGKPVDFVIGHSTAAGDMLEQRLRGLCSRHAKLTRSGAKTRVMVKVIGCALGVHRQLVAIARHKRTCQSPSPTGKIEGGGRVEMQDLKPARATIPEWGGVVGRQGKLL
ncbi:hypothetical protein ES705_43114 [subsurface metagenome]